MSNNQIIGDPTLINTTIEFEGVGNILYCAAGVQLVDSKINFFANNSLIYLSESKREFKLDIGIFNSSVVYIGKNNYFNSTLKMIASEHQHVVIGDDCLFSFEIWIRTSDVHLIYDCTEPDVDSFKRINPSKSVLIGDHVWVGQNATILKGAKLGSGSILGACSVLAGKALQSNSIYAGNPARLVREHVFFDSSSAHAYTKAKTKKKRNYEGSTWIYNQDTGVINAAQLFKRFAGCKDASERLAAVQHLLTDTGEKNRFYIAPQAKPNLLRRLLKRIRNDIKG